MKDILRIEELLRSKKMTLAELAKKIGTSQDNLHKKINSNPTINSLKDVADGLQVEFGDLFIKPNNIFGCIIVKVPDKKRPKNYFLMI